MATQLQPRTLDIEITKITAKTVYYTLRSNGQPEKWEQPDGSAFDKSTLQVGVRYVVKSRVVRANVWDFRQKKRVWIDRFDWVAATPAAPKAKLAARTSKQRQLSESLSSRPLADNGTLFVW